MRKIAVVTGTRAEYGLLVPILRLIEADKSLRLQLIVTGAHLNDRFGRTVREIEGDGFRPAAKIPLGLSGDGPEDIAEAMARGIRGFAAAFKRLKPDVVVVLGDRYEILAAAAAALPFRLPVAHIHGGEASEGAWDESVRHAVTKLSHVHFPAAPAYARRLRRLGEDPARIHCFGSPGLDRLRAAPHMSRAELARELGLPLAGPLGVVTYHPATLSADRGLAELNALLGALKGFKGTLIFTYPNADAGGKIVLEKIRAFVAAAPGRRAAFASLGQNRFFSLLRHADFMAGNSSSGLLEAPFFGLPAVNIGDRQKGRLRPHTVIDVPRPTAASVGRALKAALRRRRRPLAASGPSPSRRIVAALKKLRSGDSLLKKSFHEGRGE